MTCEKRAKVIVETHKNALLKNSIIHFLTQRNEFVARTTELYTTINKAIDDYLFRRLLQSKARRTQFKPPQKETREYQHTQKRDETWRGQFPQRRASNLDTLLGLRATDYNTTTSIY